MKEVSIHVGQRIRLYRKTKNLTIETFAGMIHKKQGNGFQIRKRGYFH